MASVTDHRPLTERHQEILRWINTQPHNHTYRNWDDSLTLAGPNGSITLSLAENDKLQGMVKPNPDKDGWREKHFVLSAAGRRALTHPTRTEQTGE